MNCNCTLCISERAFALTVTIPAQEEFVDEFVDDITTIETTQQEQSKFGPANRLLHCLGGIFTNLHRIIFM